jgi:hypothetical protein
MNHPDTENTEIHGERRLSRSPSVRPAAQAGGLVTPGRPQYDNLDLMETQ